MNTVGIDLEKKFEQIYQEYYENIFRFVLFQTKDRDVALDITAHAFMKLWDYISSGRELEYIKALLYRMAKNAIIDASRRKKAESLDILLDAGFDVSSKEESLAEIFDTKIDTDLLYAILDELPSHEKELLSLRFLEDLSLVELSEYYTEPTNTISVRIHRAIKKGRNLYEQKRKNYAKYP